MIMTLNGNMELIFVIIVLVGESETPVLERQSLTSGYINLII